MHPFAQCSPRVHPHRGIPAYPCNNFSRAVTLFRRLATYPLSPELHSIALHANILAKGSPRVAIPQPLALIQAEFPRCTSRDISVGTPTRGALHNPALFRGVDPRPALPSPYRNFLLPSPYAFVSTPCNISITILVPGTLHHPGSSARYIPAKQPSPYIITPLSGPLCLRFDSARHLHWDARARQWRAPASRALPRMFLSGGFPLLHHIARATTYNSPMFLASSNLSSIVKMRGGGGREAGGTTCGGGRINCDL